MAIGDEPKIENKERKTYRVLYAEDDGMVRNSLMDSFKYKYPNSTFNAVSDGQLLLEELETQKYDLVITDQNMPHLTGLEVLEKIRGIELLKDLPVIMFTGESDSSLKKKVTDLGATFLTRNMQGDLYTAITKVLESLK